LASHAKSNNNGSALSEQWRHRALLISGRVLNKFVDAAHVRNRKASIAKSSERSLECCQKKFLGANVRHINFAHPIASFVLSFMLSAAGADNSKFSRLVAHGAQESVARVAHARVG
jgi:hypothetical protein